VNDLHYLFSLIRNPLASAETLRGMRRSRLRQVLAAAQRDVPYYREQFARAGIDPAHLDPARALRQIPVSRKEMLRRVDRVDLCSERQRRAHLHPYSTTGSTGVPFTVLKSRLEESLALFLRWRVARYFGLKRGSTIFRLTSGMRRPGYWSALRHFRLYRDIDVRLTDPPAEIADALRRSNANVVMGNAGVLTRVARELMQRPLEKIPDFVVSSAELLTPPMRAILGAAFRCPVFDSYNCVETMHPVAWECRETGLYHVADDAVDVEVLDDGAPVREGEEGEVVITSLIGFAMPVIRWSQGDRAELGPSRCPCGSPFSTLRGIKGRMTDYLRLPDGTEMFASVLAYALHRNSDWILQYQLVQETTARIRLRVSTLRDPEAAEVASLKTEMEKLLPSEVTVEIELVDDLEPEKHGKFRVLMSRIDSPYAPRNLTE
jgi:phenylacetate-CoA ligase